MLVDECCCKRPVTSALLWQLQRGTVESKKKVGVLIMNHDGYDGAPWNLKKKSGCADHES
ncbi:unnamed protein product [Ectocarpus sp. 6 AP-2014]